MLANYNALSSSSDRTDVQRVLSSIVNGVYVRRLIPSLRLRSSVISLASLLSSTPQDRCKLVQLLLDDIKHCVSPINPQDKGRLRKKGMARSLMHASEKKN